jgi:hypothetical protein
LGFLQPVVNLLPLLAHSGASTNPHSRIPSGFPVNRQLAGGPQNYFPRVPYIFPVMEYVGPFALGFLQPVPRLANSVASTSCPAYTPTLAMLARECKGRFETVFLS